MNISTLRAKIATGIVTALKLVMKYLRMIYEFLVEPTVLPRRYMRIREPDGTEREALIHFEEGGLYSIEVRLSEPLWYCFWIYRAEDRIVKADDLCVLRIDPPVTLRKCIEHVFAR